MQSPDQSGLNDEHLVQYLLGALPEEETLRMDELSITDEDFVWRLRGVENDLVDAYLRSEMDAETLHRFTSFYLSSAKRREKVAFAEGLLRFQTKAATKSATRQSSWWSMFAAPRALLQFSAAAALLMALLAAGYLFFENARLRHEINESRTQWGFMDRRTQELEKQLEEQRTANASAQKQLELAHSSAPGLDQLKTISMVLPPPARGLSAMKTITVHPGTDLVVLVLTLESVDFPRYRVFLKDPATDKTVWSSAEMEPAPMDDKQAISAGFRVDLLKHQNYIAEVVGLPRGKGAQVVGDYPFRVVLR
jgi:hypothetical protein